MLRAEEETIQIIIPEKKKMEYTSCNSKLIIISISFYSLLFIACFGQASTSANQTFQANNESMKLNRIRAYLNTINKPAVKSIQVFFINHFFRRSDHGNLPLLTEVMHG